MVNSTLRSYTQFSTRISENDAFWKDTFLNSRDDNGAWTLNYGSNVYMYLWPWYDINEGKEKRIITRIKMPAEPKSDANVADITLKFYDVNGGATIYPTHVAAVNAFYMDSDFVEGSGTEASPTTDGATWWSTNGTAAASWVATSGGGDAVELLDTDGNWTATGAWVGVPTITLSLDKLLSYDVGWNDTAQLLITCESATGFGANDLFYIGSRENTTAAYRPQFTIGYTYPAPSQILDFAIEPDATDKELFNFTWTANTDDDFLRYEIYGDAAGLIITLHTQTVSNYLWSNKTTNVSPDYYYIRVYNNGRTTDQANYPYYTDSNKVLGRRPSASYFRWAITNALKVWAINEFWVQSDPTTTFGKPASILVDWGDSTKKTYNPDDIFWGYQAGDYILYLPCHTYTSAGTYIAQSTLVSSDGFYSIPDYTSITITNLNPTCSIEVSPQSIISGETMIFDLTKSYPRGASQTISTYSVAVVNSSSYIFTLNAAVGVLTSAVVAPGTYNAWGYIIDSSGGTTIDHTNKKTFTVSTNTATALTLTHSTLSVFRINKQRNKARNSILYGEGENIINIGSNAREFIIEGWTRMPHGSADITSIQAAADAEIYSSITLTENGKSTTYYGVISNFNITHSGGEPFGLYWTAELIEE